eukprot:TRINITY_DN48254_c0_g1_i1.p1 TRINITY_DN48254_c0_g1~~TRINITY_DN48254_c0_g1_i1.p1  ORF type:complete len:322 (+),score=63.56 TRINITY_DN48254_c0_g1_i1:103-1068(+)
MVERNVEQTEEASVEQIPPVPTPEAGQGRTRSHHRRTRNRKAAIDAILQNSALPKRKNTLDPHCKLADLDPDVASEVLAYCALTFGSNSDEIVPCLQAASKACPEGLRVKELLETFEAYHEIAAFSHDASKSRQIDTMFDMACGHGMLGALLAYRFPKRCIVCVDRTRREVFDSFVEGFRAHGEAAKDEEMPLSNLSFVEGDTSSLEIPPNAMVVAVHACNELNRQLVEAAAAASAVWAVMPCCIRSGTYLPCKVGGACRDDDESKHLLLCGVVAGMFKAERLQAIDGRITNRNILICGGAGFTDYKDAKRRCAEGRPHPE